MTKQEIGGKENKEFYEDARKVAESCSKERLVDLYLAEVQTCCEVEEENKKLVKALNGDIFINYKLPMENAQLKQQLHELPKKIVEDFYDEIRHRAILEDDYCPDHNLERKYGVRKCLLENIRTTILKKYGDKNESNND